LTNFNSSVTFSYILNVNKLELRKDIYTLTIVK